MISFKKTLTLIIALLACVSFFFSSCIDEEVEKSSEQNTDVQLDKLNTHDSLFLKVYFKNPSSSDRRTYFAPRTNTPSEDICDQLPNGSRFTFFPHFHNKNPEDLRISGSWTLRPNLSKAVKSLPFEQQRVYYKCYPTSSHSGLLVAYSVFVPEKDTIRYKIVEFRENFTMKNDKVFVVNAEFDELVIGDIIPRNLDLILAGNCR